MKKKEEKKEEKASICGVCQGKGRISHKESCEICKGTGVNK